MLTARLVAALLLVAVCAVMVVAEYEEAEYEVRAPAQYEAFSRALRSELPTYSKKWANQVRFGKRSGAGGQRSWASQVRFG